LEAAAHVAPDVGVEFVLVGDGICKHGLQERAKKDGLNNVRFLPAMPKREVRHLLAAADAGILSLANVRTLDYGVSPNKLFEYMAAGKPILCAASGAVARLVKEHSLGLVSAPEDGVGLAQNV